MVQLIELQNDTSQLLIESRARQEAMSQKVKQRNEIYAPYFDGRAIQEMVQFIEPIVLRLHEQRLKQLDARSAFSHTDSWLWLTAATPLTRAVVASSSQAGLAANVELARTLEETPANVALGYDSAPSLLCIAGASDAGSDTSSMLLSTPSAAAVTLAQQSLQLLESVRLRYVVELGIGLVIESPPPSEFDTMLEFTDVAYVEPHLSPLEAAERLLSCAGRSWLLWWLRTEGVMGRAIDPSGRALSQAVRGTLIRLFNMALVYELRRRCVEQGAVPGISRAQLQLWRDSAYAELEAFSDELVPFLEALPPLPLVKNLVCSWYPCWDRFPFILRTPDATGDIPIKIARIGSNREALE